MKNKNLIIIFTFLNLFIISCAHVKYDKSNLIGSWYLLDINKEKGFNSTYACIATNKPNDRFNLNCTHEMKGSYSQANYRVEDESEWFIRGRSYFDKTVRQELVSIDGDAELVEEIKNIYKKKNPPNGMSGKLSS